MNKTFQKLILKQLIAMNDTMQQLTVTSKLKRVVPLPCRPPTRTSMIEQVTLVDTTRFLANGGQSTRLAMFHGGSADPVDSRITTNGI
jgi:hypothetical protein